MRHELVNVFFTLCGLVVAWIEIKGLLKDLQTIREIETTHLSKIDDLERESAGALVEFNCKAMAGISLSPITQTPCAGWCFEITQLKEEKTGGTSVPIVAQTSRCKWLLFEGNTK